MKYNPETTKIMYVCLSSECNKHKMSEIGKFCDDTIVCEDDIASNEKRFNGDRLVYLDVGRLYVSPNNTNFAVNYIIEFLCYCSHKNGIFQIRI